jgi:hypothetical protein
LSGSLRSIASLSRFGINYVVNAVTFPDLNQAIELAHEEGAAEFLLLPEQPVRGVGGLDAETENNLRRWVAQYRGAVPLTMSAVGTYGFPMCEPLEQEMGLRAYAHIDASRKVKASSYEQQGVAIGSEGVFRAVGQLQSDLEKQRGKYGMAMVPNIR